MDDKDLFANIQRLVDEEHRLLEQAGDDATGQAQERLKTVEVQLDQCWDLLRQRRGRRHAGQDPDTAQVRDPNTVERYVQ